MSVIFSGEEDFHKGITVTSNKEPCNDIAEFTTKLEASLKQWKESNRRAVWFKVSIPEIHWIPVLAEHGFRIHNGVGDVITMIRWLPKDEESRVPDFAHTMVGVGAVILTENDNKLLVVRERFRQVPSWKLPGGYVEVEEDIVDAAIREVKEETNIRTEFVGLVTFRHSLKAAFGCSDLYFIVNLKPLNLDVKKQYEEIDEVKWMDVSEYLNHLEVHELNKMCVRRCLQQRQKKTTITKEIRNHPLTGKPQALYNISFPQF